MPYNAILFDLDGTLLNTLEDIADAANRALDKNGFPVHTLDAYRHFIGDGVAVLMTRALPEDNRDEDTIRALVEAFGKDYGTKWNVKTKPYDGVAEMLDALVRRGIKMAVLSNKPHELTQQCVRQLLRKWNFHAVLGQRKDVPRKPDPAGALQVAHALSISPQQFLYLGDSAVDMKTAKAAGMFAVGVLWGFRSGQELSAAGAQDLIERPSDVLKILRD